ncbi:MAG: hypothetical protein OXC69_02180 [Candidatus Tectomicrobia bacterium]|nr:hypothetical protein [Candidatus Tectomicrobia bacterium]
MSEQFRDIAPELQPFVSRSLIDGRAWERLLERVGDLPGQAAAGVGFEFRLVGDASADLAVGVAPGSPLLDYYVARGKAATPGSAAMSLGRFFAQANGSETASGSSHPGWFESAMLEYDAAEAAPGQPADPGLFIRLVHDKPDWPSLPPPRIFATTLASAVGWDHDEDEMQAVERVYAALPPGSQVGQIGAMPGRALRAIRLIVDGVEEEEVRDFLGRLGWPGQTGQVVSALDEMGDVAPVFRLSLDVSADGLSPRLGLEYYPAGERRGFDHWLTTGRSAWRPIFERLEALRWGQPDKARGLLDFTGLDKLFGERGVFILYRGINHVKVTIEADDVQAKAYAGLRFFRLDKDVRDDYEDKGGTRCGTDCASNG